MGFKDRVVALFDHAKAAESKTRAHFAIPSSQIDEEGFDSPFRAKEHYFQVVVNEMFLEKSRQWHVRYDPMAFVATSYDYGSIEATTPFVVGPSMLSRFKQDVPEGTLFRNTPVSGFHPYQGGDLSLTVFLNKVQRANNADRILQVLETTAVAIDPSTMLASYLKVAGAVLDGFQSLFGLSETVPVVGVSESFIPDAKIALRPAYWALIDEDENKIDQSRFRVTGHRLMEIDDNGKLCPYRSNDFVLVSLRQGTRRTDDQMLPFYPLWLEARDLGARLGDGDHFWNEAKRVFNTLKREMYGSPDLTRDDRTRLFADYKAQLITARREAVDESEMGPENLQLDSTERELQAVAEELDRVE
jgi:hypothetical protein